MNVLAVASFGSVLETGILSSSGYYMNMRKVGLKHNQILLGQIDELFHDTGLTMKDISLVLCTRGPGSFTAIRIVMSTAKGLAAGSDASFLTIPTFDAVADTFTWFPGHLVPVVDGRKGKFYTALYKNGKKLRQESDLEIDELQLLLGAGGPLLLIGENTAAMKSECFPNADGVIPVESGFTILSSLIDRGTLLFNNKKTCDTAVSPLYIRKSDAELEKENMK